MRKSAGVKNGTIREVGGISQIFYDHYWIRYYPPPENSLRAKKLLLDALRRRTFHHTEAGINTPGDRLEAVRDAYEQQTDAQRKRVNAAMLAAALFNRATDIFTTIVDLEEKGIRITAQDDLMQQCSQCLSEALALSGNIKHHSGEEGIDELWGEPVKVFTMPIEDYYGSRYVKIAQAMREIERVGCSMNNAVCALEWFLGAKVLVDDFMLIAKKISEILRSDSDYLILWPEFVADGEKISDYRAAIPLGASNSLQRHIKRGTNLLHYGKDLITWIANARVPMPVSSQKFLDQCADYEKKTARYLGG